MLFGSRGLNCSTRPSSSTAARIAGGQEANGGWHGAAGHPSGSGTLLGANDGRFSSQFEIGDYVLVKDNRKGFIRYIGSTGIVRGCLVGIEPEEASPAGHDGCFGGTRHAEGRYVIHMCAVIVS